MDECNPVNCKLPVWPSNSRPFYCRHGGTSGCRSCTRDWQLVTTDFPDVESAPEVLLGSELAPPSPLQPQDWLLTRNGRLEQTPEWTLNSTEPQQQAMNFSSAARCHWGRHRHVANQLTEGYTRSVRGGGDCQLGRTRVFSTPQREMKRTENKNKRKLCNMEQRQSSGEEKDAVSTWVMQPVED